MSEKWLSKYSKSTENKWLEKFKDGGGVKGDPPPIYVNSKNDPRYKAYQDSLHVYNQGNIYLDHVTSTKIEDGYTPGGRYKPSLTTTSASEARKNLDNSSASAIRRGAWSNDIVMDSDPESIKKYNPAPEVDEFFDSSNGWRTGANSMKDYFDVEENSPIKPISYSIYDFVPNSPITRGDVTVRESPHKTIFANYAKPKQEVILENAPELSKAERLEAYKKTPKYAEISAKQQKLKDAGYNIEVDGFWGEESEKAMEEFEKGVDSLPALTRDIIRNKVLPRQIEYSKKGYYSDLRKEYNPYTKQQEIMGSEQASKLRKAYFKAQQQDTKNYREILPSEQPDIGERVLHNRISGQRLRWEVPSEAHILEMYKIENDPDYAKSKADAIRKRLNRYSDK